MGHTTRMIKSTGKKNAIIQTTEEYASQATVHGVGYIFDKQLPKLDRFLWFFICLTFGILAIFLTKQSFSDWQNNQVIITLKNTAKPVTEIQFPTVAICTENGTHGKCREKSLG